VVASDVMGDDRKTKLSDEVNEAPERLSDELASGPLEQADPLEPEPEQPAESKPSPQPGLLLRFWRRIARYALSLIFEFVGLTLWLVFAEALRYLLERIYGDPKFFDRIPIRYVIDLGELALLLTFFVVAVRKLWRDSYDD
jgi:hypothetical protein